MLLTEAVIGAVLAHEVKDVDRQSASLEEWIILDRELQAAIVIEEYMLRAIAKGVRQLDKVLGVTTISFTSLCADKSRLTTMLLTASAP